MLIVVPIFAFKSLHFKLKFPFKIALKMGCHGCNFYDAFFGRFGTDFEAILGPNLAPKSGPNSRLPKKFEFPNRFGTQDPPRSRPNPLKAPSRPPKTARINPQTIQNATQIKRELVRKRVSQGHNLLLAGCRPNVSVLYPESRT